MLLTDDKSCDASVSFSATLLIAGVPAGGAGQAGWNMQMNGGISRCAHSKDGKETYFPLCAMRALGKSIASVDLSLRTTMDVLIEPRLALYEPPWPSLDDNGDDEVGPGPSTY
jgi:hypothetical protein